MWFESRFVDNPQDMFCYIKAYIYALSDYISGCFQEVLVNGKRLDFMITKRNHKITPGCSERDPCKNNKCKNGGRCRTRNNEEGYECRCKAGYSGQFCTIGEYSSDSSASKCIVYLFLSSFCLLLIP